MKKLLLFFILLLLPVSGYFFWKVSANNGEAAAVSQTEVNRHLDKTITWLETNYSKIENRNNPILWWMVKQAAENTGNPRLLSLYKKYKRNHLDGKPNNLSTPMFNKYYKPRMPDISEFRGLDDYQIFFFYGTSCDKDLGSEPLIQAQLQPDFCSLHYLKPRCITHQLMGLRFMQRYQCGNNELVANTISELQDDVVNELYWDFRIVDAYIQRVTMLMDTGAYNKIKPVWIRQILDAQNEDGSWDDYDPIVSLSENKAFAFTSLLPAVKTLKPSFHATAQGLWLLSMLSNEASTNN